MAPLYEYECENTECGEWVEVEMSIKSNGRKKLLCPECGKKKLARRISKVNFAIHGASSKNDYYIPPSNEALGYPSESQLRRNLENAEDPIDYLKHGNREGEDKELYQEKKRLEKEENKEATSYFNHLKEKNRYAYDKISGVLKKCADKRQREIDAGNSTQKVIDRTHKRMKLAEQFQKEHPDKLEAPQRIKVEDTLVLDKLKKKKGKK